MKNYIYPPEWENQRGTILIYPQRDSDWGCCFDEVEERFAEFIITIAKYQKVYLISDEPIIIDELENNENFENISGISSNDTWSRDSLALSVFKNGKPVFIKYQFNGWGGKFDASLDNQISEILKNDNFYNGDLIIEPLYIEGGAIETNGEILLLTESSILNSNRGQENSRDEVEKSLINYLGAKKIVWLENSYLAGDDTDGHIDMLARFADSNTILYSLPEIGSEITQKLPNCTLIKVPHPNYDKFPATYLNFIFVNGAILLPIYGVETDEEAIRIFQDVFPDREIVPIDSTYFIRQGGSLHCLTMQLY